MQIGVLGAIEVRRGGEAVDLGGRKQRMLLATLALHCGRPVAVDTLIDVLWGEEPPASAVGTLHVYLAGVRRALEPDRPARTPAKVVLTVPPGYALRLDEGVGLDAARFDTAVKTAHRRLGTTRPVTTSAAAVRPDLTADELAEVIGLLDGSLACWRGTPYGDLSDVPAAVAERARLEELRLMALEDRAVARLALGEHAVLTAELEALTAEHPLRERLWLLRVLALAGSGRQADALDALRQVRRFLADELGLDPGAALRELEQAVLRQDPALQWQPARASASLAPAPGPASTTGAVTTPGPAPIPMTPSEPPPALVKAPSIVLDEPQRWPHVGRRADLKALEGLLAAATVSPRFAMLVGEPGIGKTRLTQELAAGAREQGFAVLVGRCSEDEGAPPLWPWAGVLRALVDAVGAADLPEAVRAELTECSELLSPGSGRIAEPAGAAASAYVPGEVDTARFRLWDAVARVLSGVSAVRPLLVVLDDLHWADPSSLRLLSHLAETLQTGRVLVLATRRPHPEPTGPLAQCVESLGRRHALRLDLTGLTAAEAAALVEAATARRPSPGEAEALRERTEGNPFFLVELVRLLAQRGGHEGGGGDDVPSAVTDVVARRIARLPDATRELLRTAAVAGRRFDLGVLAATSGRDEDGVLDDLDPALAAGVIAEGETVDGFRFAHALVRDVVYGGLPAARRARRHAAVAGALEAGAGQSAGERLSEAARHWLTAGPAHAERAWRAAAAAADQARLLHAHDEAAALLAAARDAQRADGSATPLDRYDLLMALADACRCSADRGGVDAALAAAVGEAERLGDVERVARAAVGTAEGALWQTRSYGDTDEYMIAALRRVLRELPADDSELRCRSLLVLATELYYSDAPAYREALVEQGLAMARRLSDPSLLVWACQAAFIATWRASTAPERRRMAEEAVEAAARQSDPKWEALALTLRAIVAGETGDVARMRSDTKRARQVAERLRLAYLLFVLGALELPWLAMQGRVEESQRLLEQNLALSARISLPQLEEQVAGGLMCLELWQGRTGEMAARFQDMAPDSAVEVELAVQWMLVRAGRFDEARAVHDAQGVTASGDDWTSLSGDCVTAEVAFGLRLPDLARSVHGRLAPYAGMGCSVGYGTAIGPVDAYLALAAAACGERELAAGHADKALKLCADWEIPLVARWLRDQRDQGGF